MERIEMNKLNPFHAHVYFDQNSKQTAIDVVSELAQNYAVDVGHFHDKPVGPHPVGSVQVSVPTELFGDVVFWLMTHRRGLTVFTHADTGEVMKDHTEHTLWMGEMMALNLDILAPFVSQNQG
jgi:DOPA 4,5-dioxygenase